MRNTLFSILLFVAGVSFCGTQTTKEYVDKQDESVFGRAKTFTEEHVHNFEEMIQTRMARVEEISSIANTNANEALEKSNVANENANYAVERANNAATTNDVLALVSGEVRTLPPYLHVIHFDSTYIDDAYDWYTNHSHDVMYGGCSAVRKGNLFGRNFDFPYDERAVFVINVSATSNRHASVGISNLGTNLTERFVTSGKYSPLYRVLPGVVVDGINDAGVVCEVNVIPLDTTKDPSQGATRKLHAFEVVRHVLDNYDNAHDAALYVAAHYYIPSGDHSYHWMIADANGTYIVEDGAVIDTETTMTNCRVGVADDPYGNGYERRMILGGSGTVKELLDAVKFTNAYADGWPWPDEFAGQEDSEGKIPHYENDRLRAWANEHVAPLLDSDRKPAARGNGCWQTVHSCIYDFEKKTMAICVQEDFSKRYVFAVDQAHVDLSPIEARIEALQSGKRDLTDEKAYNRTFSRFVWTSDDPNCPEGWLDLANALDAPQPDFDFRNGLWLIPSIGGRMSVRDEEGTHEDTSLTAGFWIEDVGGDSFLATATRTPSVVEDTAHKLAKRTATPTSGALAKFDADGNLVSATANTDFVAPVSGKGLSKNDYTDADKAEVAKVNDKADEITEWICTPSISPYRLRWFTEGVDAFFTGWAPADDAGWIGVGKGGRDSTSISWGADDSSIGFAFTATRKRVLRTGDAPTPQELTNAISTNNPAFVSAVRDTPTSGMPEDMPSDWGTYGTVGAALAALAAFVKWAKAKIVAVIGNDGKPTDQFATDLLGKQVANAKVRYALSTASSATMADRTVNIYTLSSGTVPMAFPTATTHDGKTYARDFLLKLTYSGGALQMPQGVTKVGDELSFEAGKTYLIAFTEIAADKFYVRSIDITEAQA